MNKNQTLTTKSMAASSSYLKSAGGGEEMALLVLVIDMQRQFGESSLQLKNSLVKKCELLGAWPWGSALRAPQHGSAMQKKLPNQGFA